MLLVLHSLFSCSVDCVWNVFMVLYIRLLVLSVLEYCVIFVDGGWLDYSPGYFVICWRY
jgi:uncharacterized membrane protein YGL010W